MTDLDVIEQRLRRTFRVVAELPVTPVGVHGEPGTSPIEPGTSPVGPWRRRHLRILVGAAAAVVAVAAIAFTVSYGPRSSGTAPGTRSAEPLRAAYAPATTASPTVLRREASMITARLRALGRRDVRVAVAGGMIDVYGQRISGTDLRLIGQQGSLLLRPVECGALPYSHASTGPAGPIESRPLPTCAARYLTDTANLRVTPGPGGTGFSENHAVAPDPAFTSFPSSTGDDPTKTVLLPSSGGNGQYARWVLGPAGITSADIADVRAQHVPGTGWVLDVTLTPPGAARWDAFAFQYFHEPIAVDVDGAVVSAPVTEPSQATFSSFNGRIEISGDFTAIEARRLAAFLPPIPVPLVRRAVFGGGG
jgi:hypothetical protein